MRNKKKLLFLVVLAIICIFPALAQAAYTPIAGDNLPDSYAVYYGDEDGDLEDVIYDDGNEFRIDSERGPWLREYIEISFLFTGPYETMEGITIDFEVVGVPSNSVYVSVKYDGDSSYTGIDYIDEDETYIDLDPHGDIVGIKLYRQLGINDDFYILIDQLILDYE